jgi:MoaA/NifB/PqqE/SkfB family radical SAM enzyme
VAAKVLTPEEAVERYKAAKTRFPNLTVAGIAGPGDALANFPAVSSTLSLIRKLDGDVTFCVSTNGLRLPEYAAGLITLGVSHLTVTINTLDEKVGGRIYRFVNYGGVRHILRDGARILIENQQAGLAEAAKLGLVIKVNIVLIKGINDGEIPRIVTRVKELGAQMTNIMQLIPVRGTFFEGVPMTSRVELDRTRMECAPILPQMFHCQHCRSDAVGTLDKDEFREFAGEAADTAQGTGRTLRVAVASRNGMAVDLHFGHASSFYIYEAGGDVSDEVEFLERRDVAKSCGGPGNCGGSEGDAFDAICDTLSDVDAVLVIRIGERPRGLLEERGIRVFLSCDYAAAAVKEAAVKLQELRVPY